MTVWRQQPEIEAVEAGLNGAILDEMTARFNEAAEAGALFSGAQMALYRHGRLALDVGGGTARTRTGEPVTPETMFVLFSSTKGLAALVMWMLHERGAVGFDDPVVKHWPSFASIVPEKAAITIRHVMGHRGGFPLGPDWFTARYWGDHDAMVRAMEEVPLQWRPGEHAGYHALNFGWVLNELCIRTDAQGRDLGQFLREEACRPLGIEDLYVGLPDDEALEARVAWVEEPEEPLSTAAAAGVGAGGPAGPPRPDQVFRSPVTDDRHRATPELGIPWNRPAVHRAVAPGGGGIATARALAKVYAALSLGGELNGVRIISRESLEQAIVPTTKPGEVDRTLGLPMRWGTGWQIGSAAEGATPRTFGHGGRGGQMGWADLDRGLAFGFTTTGQLKAEAYQRWLLDLQSLAFRACVD